MDSKVINKLIRSEVWPVLRELGFTSFDARNAFAYMGPFVNVLNFQSFDSRLAEGLGCTTYSFSVNLGVYVLGSAWEHQLKRDKAGRVRPPEYACSLRSRLLKRSTVDGFKREDIFYIHPDGRTTANCFREVLELIQQFAAPWFTKHNNLEWMLAQMGEAPALTQPKQRELSSKASCGSYNWHRLHSMLALLRHKNSPSQATADEALEPINRMIGNVLDFSTIQASRIHEEGYSRDVAHLWPQLGSHKPIPVFDGTEADKRGSLDRPMWTAELGSPDSTTVFQSGDAISARKQLWPLLKGVGFTEFTERLAHRISRHRVEVIEFLPVDNWEQKHGNLPKGLFRLGIGIFWPLLSYEGIHRTNGKGEPRPAANECHISNWLGPDSATFGKGRMIFHSVEDALLELRGNGFAWFDKFSEPGSALKLLECTDWELFWRYPMMRGYGSEHSRRRLVYQALFAGLLGNWKESHRFIEQAASVPLGWCPSEYFREREEAWFTETRNCLHALQNSDM